jgi:hypothetical protein
VAISNKKRIYSASSKGDDISLVPSCFDRDGDISGQCPRDLRHWQLLLQRSEDDNCKLRGELEALREFSREKVAEQETEISKLKSQLRKQQKRSQNLPNNLASNDEQRIEEGFGPLVCQLLKELDCLKHLFCSEVGNATTPMQATASA